MKAELLEMINAEDCTGDLHLIADSLGIETARRLFNAFRGCMLNIPSRIPKAVVSKYALQQAAKGRRVKDIAHELGFSERTIQNVLAKGISTK